MIRLDRRDWLKLRAKEARNFIPEKGKQVMRFGVDLFQALKEEDASWCPLPSPLQRLALILLRIMSKMRVHTDAGPFL
jgi:hypothetical protein